MDAMLPKNCTLVPVEAVYDDYERQLLQIIDGYRREYEAAVKPYIDMLTRSRALKLPKRYVVVPKNTTT